MILEYFPLIYDLNGSNSKINRHLLSVDFKRFPVYFSLFVLLFFCNSMPRSSSLAWSGCQFKKVSLVFEIVVWDSISVTSSKMSPLLTDLFTFSLVCVELHCYELHGELQ